MARELGDKLGPRLASLVRQHTLASRLALAPVEATIAAAGTQKVIDRAGRETAEHYRGIIAELLRLDDSMPPWLTEYLSETASGQHQWRSIAGTLGLSQASGAISTVLNNYLGPSVRDLVRLAPAIDEPPETAAAAAAAGLVSIAYAEEIGTGAGLVPGKMDLMRDLAQTIPGAPDLHDMHNRGLISAGQLQQWLVRLALPPDLIGPVSGLGRQLLSPADAALAVLRGNMSAADGAAIAAANGMTAADFQTLIDNTGEPPAIEEMLMLRRRGQISDAELDRAILQSRVRDEWIPAIKLLSIEPPAQADVLEALVQGELSPADALTRYTQAGGDPTYFDVAWKTRANSPAPGQLAEMLNRGIITEHGTGPDAITFDQGFVEGRWKDKWLTAFRQLAVYLPPPREISTLVKESGLTQDQAMALWEQHGMTAELAQAYWTAAHYQKTSAVHELARGEIVTLYTDQAIDSATATTMLQGIGWTATDAAWLLDIADLRRDRLYLERAISKISGLFIAHKLDGTAAAAALASLEVPASQADALIKLWTLEQGANVRTLTAAELTDAVFYQLMDAPTAQAQLQQLGYTAHDAWLLISIRAHGPIPNYPDPG